MCGIAGIISLNGSLDETSSTITVEKMNVSQDHRGPDGSGVYFGEEFCFGHSRLSIVDLSDAGHQPMIYLDRYVITYNGEVYNHVELRKELEELGYSFQSDTDTEVIMAAYDCWGRDCVKRFNGMWAFVIYDKTKRSYFLSRDRFGIKPFYYTYVNDEFIFASEIKAITCHPRFKVKANREHLKFFLDNGAREWLSETSFQGVYKFPFSESSLLSSEQLKKGVQSLPYWEVIPNISKERFDECKAKQYAEKYYELLKDAVRIRLRADVKVGSALSGGLDSSSIVYLVNQFLRAEGKEELQETFSSVYKSKGTEDCDESEYIDLLADKLSVSSNQIEPKTENIPTELAKVIKHMEIPPESCCMSAWHTFLRVKSSDVTVTLDGQGADEQLAGYVYYIRVYLLSLSLTDFIKEAKYFAKLPGGRSIVIQSAMLRGMLAVFGEKRFKKIFSALRGWDIKLNLNEALHQSTFTTLISLIHFADHTSMAHSVESRMPFMDYRLIEFLSSIPACYKMHNGWTKYIARLAFDGKLPDEVCWRKDKMGWPVPEEHWFKGDLSEWVLNTIQSSELLNELSVEVDENSVNSLNIIKLVRYLNVALFEKTFLRA